MCMIVRLPKISKWLCAHSPFWSVLTHWYIKIVVQHSQRTMLKLYFSHKKFNQFLTFGLFGLRFSSFLCQKGTFSPFWYARYIKNIWVACPVCNGVLYLFIISPSIPAISSPGFRPGGQSLARLAQRFSTKSPELWASCAESGILRLSCAIFTIIFKNCTILYWYHCMLCE